MIRMIGAGLIVAGSGAFGFAMAAAHRREERQLAVLLKSLEYMSCELNYRQTPLPGLCRDAAIRSTGDARRAFRDGAPERRRSCQTLGLCAGAALAILFL